MEWLSVLGWGQEEIEDLRFVGYSYLRQGKYDIAITFFEALVILAPSCAYDLQTLGALYLQTGKSTLALSYLEKAIAIEPNHLPTLLNRAKALLDLGYRKQAIEQAKNLEGCSEQEIAHQAQALLMACISSS